MFAPCPSPWQFARTAPPTNPTKHASATRFEVFAQRTELRRPRRIAHPD
jgi:hypothetical protein